MWWSDHGGHAWQDRELGMYLVGSGELEIHHAGSTGICLAGCILYAHLRSNCCFPQRDLLWLLWLKQVLTLLSSFIYYIPLFCFVNKTNYNRGLPCLCVNVFIVCQHLLEYEIPRAEVPHHPWSLLFPNTWHILGAPQRTVQWVIEWTWTCLVNSQFTDILSL